MPFASAVNVAVTSIPERAALDISGALTTADGTNGNKFIANRNTILRVKNTGAQITVTVHVPYTHFGKAVSDFTFIVGATTGDVLWSGFETIFHQNASKEVWVEFSAVTGVTLAAYQPL